MKSENNYPICKISFLFSNNKYKITSLITTPIYQNNEKNHNKELSFQKINISLQSFKFCPF
jgi:hypothetical protein